ncbi:hypothetical protein DEM27_05835 [Metarhizobium album]|uniref:Arc-like DNA binding domain-containing protein n=1 Tax=Metarhizobium album TaxID=2182425 RepID=A0A2U2DV42_9HYPH|nr:Arc family DNA-binding protein [Rhizobium album]PWE57161.1 hypothetical protein DEM27_05835 [Rhizobium album]
MTRDDPQMKLRLPQELKTAIEKSAANSKRSLNSEIVHRLHYSFDAETERSAFVEQLTILEAQNQALRADQARSAQLEQSLDGALRDNARQAASWEEWATQQFTDENTVYVLLDANGHPQSWDEIMAHLQAIGDAIGGKIERIDAAVVDPAMASNSKRAEQWMKLREFYRSKQKPEK